MYVALISLPHFITSKLVMFPISMVIRSVAIIPIRVSIKMVRLNGYGKESDRGTDSEVSGKGSVRADT